MNDNIAAVKVKKAKCQMEVCFCILIPLSFRSRLQQQVNEYDDQLQDYKEQIKEVRGIFSCELWAMLQVLEAVTLKSRLFFPVSCLINGCTLKQFNF
mgnify:CR=1 FL=1